MTDMTHMTLMSDEDRKKRDSEEDSETRKKRESETERDEPHREKHD